MVYGINEPGEQPADTVVREIKEETGIDAVVTDLVAVTSSSRVITYANGDNTMYMDHSFLCALKPGGNAVGVMSDRMNLMLDVLGHPEHSFRVIHVTGTNGKGSTARMAEALCRGGRGKPERGLVRTG